MSSAPAIAPAGGFHIPSLDGIRALSFLLVFAAHSGLERFIPGGFGVTVFFFLSGYLITTLLRIEDDSTGTVRLGQFYLRRALRILPPFYVVLGLAAGAAYIGVLPGGVAPQALCAQALHLANYWIVRHGYDGMAHGTGVYWSLAVEEHFYIVFPCFYLAVRQVAAERRQQAAVIWGLCAAVLAWRCFLVFSQHVPADRTYVGSDTRLDSILFGCALALSGNPMLDVPARGSTVARSRWLGLPIGIVALLFTFVYRNAEFRETLRYTVQGIALTAVFTAAMRFPDWGPFRVLNVRAMSFLGVLSYPLYLVHHVILSALAGPLGLGPLRAAVALAASVALAWALHELVEKPCARLRRRLAKRTPAALARPALDLSTEARAR